MATDPRLSSNPPFNVGDTVWTLGGVSGQVTDIRFDADNQRWLVDTTQVSGFIVADELLNFNPRPDIEPVDFESFEQTESVRDGFVTQDRFLLLVADVLALRDRPVGITSTAVEVMLTAEREVILEIVAEASASQLSALRRVIEESFTVALAEQRTQLEILISTVTTALSRISDRLDQTALETQQASGLNPVELLDRPRRRTNYYGDNGWA